MEGEAQLLCGTGSSVSWQILENEKLNCLVHACSCSPDPSSTLGNVRGPQAAFMLCPCPCLSLEVRAAHFASPLASSHAQPVSHCAWSLRAHFWAGRTAVFKEFQINSWKSPTQRYSSGNLCDKEPGRVRSSLWVLWTRDNSRHSLVQPGTA